MPITKATYVDAEGEPYAIYHTRTNPPDKRRDAALAGAVTHSWTHDLDEQSTCVACTEGKLPPEIK